ncbi:MAG: hypothetical protein L0Y80_04355 [Ignavibacteriae bacterium]|nr:hypothetical protein [Ignavibacteriota bacterium]
MFGQTTSDTEENTAVPDSLSTQIIEEQKPLTTQRAWTIHKLDGNQLLWQPDHELDYSLARLPGLLSRNNELFVRGSLAREVGYFLDGISFTNPFNNSAGFPLILETIEQVDFHTGAYGAQFGGANGGLAQITMRKGSDALTGGINIQTDDFAGPSGSFLGAGSNGYRRFVGTAQGSVAGVQFFAAAQHRYLRNRQPMFLEPFRFDNLTTDAFGSWPEGTPLPGPIEFQRNYLYNNWLMENTLQGNLTYSFEPFEIRAFGSYSFEEHPEGGDWSSALENYFRKRKMMNETTTKFGALQMTHKISSSTSYTISFSAYDRFNEELDPDFGDNWLLYTDSLASIEKGYIMPNGSNDFQTRFLGPPPYSIIYAFNIAHPFTPNNYYAKNSQSSYSLAAEATTEILPFWKVSGGGKIDWWTTRGYRIDNISAYATYFDYLDSQQPQPPLTESEKRAEAFRRGSVAAYGYDYKGIETDDELDPPRTPQFLSLFLDNELNISEFTFRAGGRYDRFARGARTELTIVAGNLAYPPKEKEAVGFFLPRLNVSFRPSSQYHFYAAFGKYAQLPALADFIRGSSYTQGDPYIISRDSRIEPLRTSQYEVGGTAILLEAVSLSTRMYYKSLINQPAIVRAYNTQGNLIVVGYRTVQEEAITRGLELSTRVTFFTGAIFDAHYVLSDWRVQGVAGDANVRPSQRFVASLDYHSRSSNPYLQDRAFAGVGFTVLFTAESGLPYTRIAGFSNLGQATPWNIGARPFIQGGIPAEPLYNSSTPWSYYLDVKFSASVMIGPVQTELYAAMLNILNTKNILNVYPTTGSADNDGWLDSPFSTSYKAIPNYEAFYRTAILKNHWAFSQATGADMYGTPRQLRIGMKVSI